MLPSGVGSSSSARAGVEALLDSRGTLVDKASLNMSLAILLHANDSGHSSVVACLQMLVLHTQP